MQRITLPPRPDWRERVETLGLTWHTAPDGTPYWDESAYWLFSAAEIDRIEAATTELYDMCLTAIGHVVDTGGLAAFGYDADTAELITASWNRRTHEATFYARFDLAYDGRNLKLLELNGDTPTSLLEAAVVQWYWLEERFPNEDQFNSIHEHLQAALRLYADYAPGVPLHFTCVAPHDEDEGTTGYIASIAAEAGIETIFTPLEQIGWRSGDGFEPRFVDQDDRDIQALFKLVPWEWLLDDPFGQRLAEETLARRIRPIEPAWKMAASNKRLLVTLHELFPGHELLLDAAMDEATARGWGDYVRKPVRGREGANVSIVRAGEGALAANDGAYGDDLFVYQRRADLAQADGRYAVLGSWVVNRQACGLGVRESDSPITNNLGRFVPHVMTA